MLDEFNKLSTEYDFLYLGRKLNGNYEDELIVNDYFVEPGYSYWTIGYMITLKGIRKLLDANPLSRMLPVDEFLPLMYGKHTNTSLYEMFENYTQSASIQVRPLDKLNALCSRHLLVYPIYYVGDDSYVSDTEDSSKIVTESIANQEGLIAKYLPPEVDEPNSILSAGNLDNDEHSHKSVNRLKPPPKVEL